MTPFASRPRCCARLMGLLAVLSFAASSAAAQTRSSVTGAWAAAPSLSMAEEDRQFSDGPVPLDGTLYLPKSAKPVPAIVVFHAASVPTRDLSLYTHLKQLAPALGVAVFVFDRRGSGRSGGKDANGDYVALADDGVAALRMLAKDPRIDPKRIGFWGLSQGGWISLIAASRCPETAFAVAISAPMVTPDIQMNFAVANILRIKGYPQAEIDAAVAARTAIDDFERGRRDRASTQAILDAAAAKPWFDLTYMDRTFRDPDKSGWALEMRQDPMDVLPRIKAPVLILYGAADPWVPVARSIERLHGFEAAHPNVSIAVIAGADHDMSLTTSPEAQIDPNKLAEQIPDAPEYFARLGAWLAAEDIAKPVPGR